MPSVKVSSEVFSMLVAQARGLDITVKDLTDMIVLGYFGDEEKEEEEEEEESESESEEEEEEEEEED